MEIIELFHWMMILPILGAGMVLSCFSGRYKSILALCAAVPMLSLGCLLVHDILGKSMNASFRFEWIPELGVSLDFYFSPLKKLMLYLVLGIGVLIVLYAKGYFEKTAKFKRFLGLAIGFMFAMSGLILSDNLILMFIFWELTGILSFFLVAFYFDKEENRLSAKRALLITTSGGLFLLAGILLLGEHSGTYLVSEMLIHQELAMDTAALNWIAPFIILGCITKSAQFPFHFWLPGAMSAPTPASAYLHSATMVKAGVFLLALLQPIFRESWVWESFLTVVGSLTLLFGASQSIFCRDLKAILAYTTIAILGALVLLIGIGTPASIKAMVILLVAHALYKATLFMIAGIIDLKKGTRDLKKLGGMRSALLIPAIAAGLASFSMSGFPGTLGFIAKEYKYKALLDMGESYKFILLVVGVITSALMMYSALQVGIRPFQKNDTKETTLKPIESHRAIALYVPPLVLGLTGILLGLFPNLISSLVIEISHSISSVKLADLKLWHGLNLVLGLSAITLTLGIVIWVYRNKIAMKHFLPFGTVSFDNLLNKVNVIAEKNSNYLKHSSLKANITVILLVTIAFIWIKFWRYGAGLDFENLNQPMLMPGLFCFLLVVGSLLSCSAKTNTQAIIFMSLCGVGTSMLFMFFGAPDLAITQISVDVLLMILFVAILSKVSGDRPESEGGFKLGAFLLSASVGATFALVVYKSISIQLSGSISKQLGEWSYQLAHGANVVNVILVDFRAIDTLGEITVLCIAALGISALSKRKKISAEVGS